MKSTISSIVRNRNVSSKVNMVIQILFEKYDNNEKRRKNTSKLFLNFFLTDRRVDIEFS